MSVNLLNQQAQKRPGNLSKSSRASRSRVNPDVASSLSNAQNAHVNPETFL